MAKNFFILLILTALVGITATYGQYSAANAFFDIRNEQRIGSLYHFDVYMRSDVPTTYLARGMVYVYYDTATFGNSVVLNNKVSITQLDLLKDSINLAPGFKIHKYETSNITDNGNRVVMVWQSPWYVTTPPPPPASYPTWFTQVPDTFTSLYHVVLQMKNPAGPANLALDLGLMFSPPPSQQFFFNPNADPNVRSSWTLPYGSGVLPATLASFSGKQTGPETVTLEWLTQREFNNAKFIVEKSLGSPDDFRPVGEVAGAGDSESPLSYQFTDNGPLETVNFYRLKQVNYNGDIAHSETIEVLIKRSYTEELMQVYPNPATGSANLIAGNGASGPLRYTLMDLTGRPLLTGVINDKSHRQQLSLDPLPQGTYLIRAQDKQGKTQITRLLVK